jgi:hypothetical protein
MKVRLIKEACSWPHEIVRRHVGTFSPPKRSDAPSTSACHARAVARCIWAALAARHYTVYDVEDSVNRGKVTALRPKKASCLLRLRPGLSVMSVLCSCDRDRGISCVDAPHDCAHIDVSTCISVRHGRGRSSLLRVTTSSQPFLSLCSLLPLFLSFPATVLRVIANSR